MSARTSGEDVLSQRATYQHATLEGDIVMKGGVTSGIVYPRAICRIARDFRLRSIGGTSAGAIAAACAAAAELGRGQEAGGFARLADLPRRLGEKRSGGRSSLGHLFQPTAAAAPLFAVLRAGMSDRAPWRRVLRMLWTAVVRGGWWVVIGLVPAVIAGAFVAARQPATTPSDQAIVAALAASGVLIGAIWRLAHVLRRVLPRQGFGMCAGLTTRGSAEPGLTDWLYDELQTLAGIDRAQPLTFATLRAHGIDLQVVTTCLTHGRPYGLPGLRRTLYFDPREFRELFPHEVVEDLVQRGEQRVADDRNRARRAREHRGMHPRLPLPRNDELPVIVVVRMSLSFPLLLSAVPLWDYDWGEQRPDDEAADEGLLTPERIWFSDGGISSNFPIHLFDAPLPTRPTFAIDLRYHPNGVRLDDSQRVQLAQTNRDRIDEDWSRLAPIGADDQRGTALAFLIRILGSMQNWTDNMQAKLPGFRDRIATIHLEHGEGGLNLEPAPARIEALAAFGERAGGLLAERFSQPASAPSGLDWTNHRWTRLRTTLAAFEEWLAGFDRGYRHDSVPTYDDLVDRPASATPTSYRLTVEQRRLAEGAIRALQTLQGSLQAAPTDLAVGSPRPRPRLKAAPRWNFRQAAAHADDGCDAGRCDRS